ncbi:MAG: hypothetical protein ACI9AU_001285 [Bacteroidia bacterium]|jgi:hypothetical protein
MKQVSKKIVVYVLLLFSSTPIFGQTLELGTLLDFEAFTGSGAVTGPGSTGTCTGDVGTNDGVISGFDTSYTGTSQNNNALTVQARIDLLRVYIHLSNVFVSHPNNHTPSFGGGDTLTPGVYSIDGAGSIGGALILNGGGDTNAVFIVKFDGAFTVATSSTVTLYGGTRARNVYWIAEGDITIGATSTIKGTLFSHFGVVSLGAGCDIEGRLLNSEAITFGAGTDAVLPTGPISIPVSISSSRPPATAVDVLRSVEDFTLFTGAGAVSNIAASGFIGDIGSQRGVISGFTTSTQVGSLYNADNTTAQAKIDLDTAYSKLVAIPVTDSTHASAFGSGDTLTAGVYYMSGAGSLKGTLTLDGQNDPDAIFVIRFNGAFSVVAQSNVIFTNGTRACNVFWIAEGAVSMGTFSFMKGTMLSHNFACSAEANANVEGRMLSTAGAVSFSTGVIYNDQPINSPVPMTLLSFTAKVEGGHVQLNWVTTAEINNDYFDVEHSVDGINFTSISRIKGAGNSTQTLNYSTIHHTLSKGVSYYRLKQTDYDGKTSYSDKQTVEFETNEVIFDIYPNPFSGEVTFHTSENLKDASLVVYNSQGVVREIGNISSQIFTLHRENLRSGLYWIKLVQGGKVIAIKKVVITE